MEANANSRNCNHSIHSPSPPTQLLYLHSNLVRPGLETFFFINPAQIVGAFSLIGAIFVPIGLASLSASQAVKAAHRRSSFG
jgi:hypothetical protein